MASTALPNEILAQILMFLSPKQILLCRQVCRRWRDVIDDLPNSFWEENINRLEDREYATARSKYGMSWFATYKALNSWHNIKELPMNIRSLSRPCTNINGFQILPNNSLALFKNLRNKSHNDESDNCDTIVYYNLGTNKECGRQDYDDFIFCDYKENEHFKALQKADRTVICIVTKYDNQRHYIEGEEIGFAMFDKDLYSFTPSGTIVLCKIVEKDGKPVLLKDTLPLPFSDPFTYLYDLNKKDGKLYVLLSMGLIRVLTDKNTFEEVINPTLHLPYSEEHPTIYQWFTSYGFYGKAPHHYYNLGFLFGYYFFHELKYSIFYRHMGNIAIFTEMYEPRGEHRDITFEPTIYIIVGSQGICGPDVELPVVNLKRYVDLSKEITGRKKIITDLDIIETETHHVILALANKRLYIVEFQYANLELSYRIKLRSHCKRKLEV